MIIIIIIIIIIINVIIIIIITVIFNNYSLKSRWIVAEYSPTCKARGGEYSESHYSPRLKRIIVLAYTNSVTTTHSRKVSKNFQFDLFKFLPTYPQ